MCVLIIIIGIKNLYLTNNLTVLYLINSNLEKFANVCAAGEQNDQIQSSEKWGSIFVDKESKHYTKYEKGATLTDEIGMRYFLFTTRKQAECFVCHVGFSRDANLLVIRVLCWSSCCAPRFIGSVMD